MCAAPGGKSLVLISRLISQGASTEFIANEISGPRREALTKVIQNYTPMEFRKNVWVKGLDGVKYGMNNCSFDAILLDTHISGKLTFWKIRSSVSGVLKERGTCDKTIFFIE